MANIIFGKIYFFEKLAGELRQEANERFVFQYDDSFIESSRQPIAYTLPLRKEPYISIGGLHPFFDNLVSEGWLKNAQAKALGVDPEERFKLLLAFGQDCIGAVSIVDPEPAWNINMQILDKNAGAALRGKASLSGIQPKIPVIRKAGKYYPVNPGELSTHIAKLPGELPNLLELEYLTTLAVKNLLKDDRTVNLQFETLGDIDQTALVIERFDRAEGGKRLHFEEINQLLGKKSSKKYEGSYEDMAKFILETPGCIPAESERLFRRILACVLTGNTDSHLKNFAMFHENGGFRLTPAYDQVASAFYKDYQTMALDIVNAHDLKLSDIKPRHVLKLGENFELSKDSIHYAVDDIGKNLQNAKDKIEKSEIGEKQFKNRLIELMEKRWRGTFESIGRQLSKKLLKKEKNRG